MTTEVETQTSDGVISQWPPVAHIINKKITSPVEEGHIALCGAKIMGIDLGDMAVDAVCEACVEIIKRQAQ